MSAPQETGDAPIAAEAAALASSVASRAVGRTFSIGAILQLAGINLLWAASSVAAKSGLESFGPFTLSALRFFPAGLALLALAGRGRPRPRLQREDWPAFGFLGGVGIALTYGLFNFGLNHTTATDSSVLFACEPILIALFARLFLHEALTLRQWTGMVIGLVGIWLIAGQAFGNLIVLLAVCAESTTGVVAKRLTGTYPGLMVVGVQMLLGSLLLFPLAGWELLSAPHPLTWAGIGGWLYLSVVCSMLCFGVWYHLLGRFPISAMGVFILTQPMFGPIYGWALRGETLKPVGAVGCALVIFGIALTTLAPQRRGG